MPYKIIEQDNEWCVFKHDEKGEPAGKTKGCHPTRKEAEAHMRALYAAEEPAKSFSFDEKRRLVEQAWYVQFWPDRDTAQIEIGNSRPWIRDVFDDKIVVDFKGKVRAYSYTEIQPNTLTFGEPVVVQIDYVPQTAPGAKSYAVKMVSQDDAGATVGGYLLLWGSPKAKDLQGDWFTPNTELLLDHYKTAPVLFHHGLDDNMGGVVIGKRESAIKDETGVWVQDWLDKSNRYWRMVEPLLQAERLFYSPGSAPHMVKRVDDKPGELLRFAVVEDTLTPFPAQYRLRPIEQIKAAYKSASIDMPETVENGEAEAGASGLDTLRMATDIELFLVDLVEG